MVAERSGRREDGHLEPGTERETGNLITSAQRGRPSTTTNTHSHRIMTSDETYLESYIESISTLPSEIRRNLGLLKSLDQSCAARTKELRDSEEAYLLQALEIIQAIPVGSKPLNIDGDGGGDGGGDGEESESEMPRTKKRKLKEGDDVATVSSSTTCTSKNNQQQQEDDKSGSDESPSNLPTNIWAQQPQKGAIVQKDGKSILVVPTTQELRSQIENPQSLRTIATLRRQTRDYIAEKLAVASQTYSIVNEAIKRLDTDLETFEGLLKGTGQFETVVVGAQPDSLAAIQVMPNSQDWILAKVISHDTHSGMYKLSDEDIESSKSEIYIHVLTFIWRMVFLGCFSLMQYDANSHYSLFVFLFLYSSVYST